MIFTELPLKGAFAIEFEPRCDDRGFFARTWCEKEFEAHGLRFRIAQGSFSYNHLRGTLRGLHYQAAPHAEAKLVWCPRGAIYDVIVDLRSDSSTYLRWTSVVLAANNRKMVYVPEGFAHGFQTLQNDTEVSYNVSAFYTPDAARGLRWNDPILGIGWPDIEQRVISEKDQTWPLLPPPPHTNGRDAGITY